MPVAYREQMPMMQELRKQYVAGKLNDKQSVWLHSTKPEEELYDLENDPYELENLADRPELKDTLILLREVLKDWMKETKDLGQYAERDLIEKWLPDGMQPKLPPLEMEENKSGIRLISKKADATIIWKQPNDSIWRIYDTLLPLGTLFEAKAERIGFSDSEILLNN